MITSQFAASLFSTLPCGAIASQTGGVSALSSLDAALCAEGISTDVRMATKAQRFNSAIILPCLLPRLLSNDLKFYFFVKLTTVLKIWRECIRSVENFGFCEIFDVSAFVRFSTLPFFV